MKIKVKNLGALKQAEFTLGDLTLICGENNTGKTYATYALFGFLYTWEQMIEIKIPFEKIEQLLTDGVMRLEIQEYVQQAGELISQACRNYTQQLSKIFAAPEERFKRTEFQIEIDVKNINLKEKFEQTMRTTNSEVFSVFKKAENSELIVTLLTEKENLKIPTQIIESVISETLKEIIFSPIFPNAFIASAERTGAAIFRKELNFARNRLIEEMGQTNKNIDPMELLFKVYQDYALPIKMNVDFTRDLESVFTKTSFIAEQYPDILSDFSDIIGGEYIVTKNDQLFYIPKRNKRIKLTMDESSSAVRSLLDIGFYLRHSAEKGDLLMVDEPELNLHPENQRRMARLFSRLVNLGIKIFITTHSDYMVKELNTLIMLNHDKPHLKRIAIEEGYRSEELISADQVKVYIAEEAPVQIDGKKRKTKCQTLVSADIDSELGIEVRSFDTTIEKMNRIQEAIVWGEE